MKNKCSIDPREPETAPLDVEGNAQIVECTAKAAAVHHLLACYDRIDDALQIVESQCGASKQRRRRQRPLVRTLRHVQGTLLRIMETLHIRPMELQDRVDFRLHEPVGVLHTQRVEDEGRIVDVVRRGFVNTNGVVRSQQVVVLKFVPRHDQR